MNKIIINVISRSSIIILVVLAFFSCRTEKESDFSKRAKIALRDAGNKLLLRNNDSTSLILPVRELSFNKFQLTFNSSLSFEPSDLVGIIDESLIVSKLPKHYIVEVFRCDDEEVAYSYQMSAIFESTIIPCSGRFLPKSCYNIQINFTKKIVSSSEKTFYGVLIISFIIILFMVEWYRKKFKTNTRLEPINYEAIGSFKFYPEQNKLMKEAEEIALSKKECELLALFVQRPNEIIKRDELTKKVWEDNGVFVGRSLDTYISKLRKKLKADRSIKLTNIHGVGYKLEIN